MRSHYDRDGRQATIGWRHFTIRTRPPLPPVPRDSGNTPPECFGWPSAAFAIRSGADGLDVRGRVGEPGLARYDWFLAYSDEQPGEACPYTRKERSWILPGAPLREDVWPKT